MAGLNFFLLLSLLLLVSSSTVCLAEYYDGTAGFTSSPYSAQACTWRPPITTMFTGVNQALYGNGDICGQKYRVSCVGGVEGQPSPCRTAEPVVVAVTDSCSPGADKKPCPTFVLSEEAFAFIARPQAGFAKISYELDQ